jgi:DNA gyrase subunit B
MTDVGIPLGINEKTNKSTLETVLSHAHSGAKFGKNPSGEASGDSKKARAYKTAGGMHGIGLTAVNALSSTLEA